MPTMTATRRCAPPSDRARLQHGRAAPGVADRRLPRRMGRDRAPARRRSGRRPPPAAADGPARPVGRRRSATCTPTTTSTSSGCATCSRGASRRRTRCRSTCRPAARARLDALATAVSERAGLLRRRLRRREYDPDAPAPDRRRSASASSAAATTSRPGASSSRRPTASRLAYTGDTGPSRPSVDADARRGPPARRGGAAPAASRRPRARPSHRRGGDRDGASAAGPGSALLVHYAPARRAELEALCDAAGPCDPPGGRRPDDHHRPPAVGDGAARRPRSGAPIAPRAASSAASARDR